MPHLALATLIPLCSLISPLPSTGAAQKVDSSSASEPAAETVLTIPLKFEKKLGRDSHSFMPLYQYEGNGRIMHQGQEHTIQPPELAPDRSVAYGFVYFTGSEGALDRANLILVEGHDELEPRFHIDLNNNLDLRDDPYSALREEETGYFILTLHALGNEEHQMALRVGLLGDVPAYIELPERLAEMGALLSGTTRSNGGTPLEPGLWLFEQLLNTRSASVEMGGHRFQIGVHDQNCSGTYADEGGDLVLIGEHGAKYLSASLSSGAAKLGEENLLQIQGQTFEILEVDPAGKFVRIAPSDKPYTRLIDGAPLPAAELTLLDGSQALLSSFVQPGKYLLIDFWGEWCVGCIQAIPELRYLWMTYDAQLTILGIHNGDHDLARTLLEEEKLTWSQATSTEALIDRFLIDRWPTYILIDPQGRIRKLGIEIAEVIQILDAEGASQQPEDE